MARTAVKKNKQYDFTPKPQTNGSAFSRHSDLSTTKRKSSGLTSDEPRHTTYSAAEPITTITTQQ